MTRICVDTSAYSQFERGHSECIRHMDEAGEVLVPVVTLAELRIGFRLGAREEKNEKKLQAFLAKPAVRIAGIDAEAADLFAGMAADLRRAGKKMNANDLWIAAIALRDGATVLTFDDDFLLVPRVGSLVLKP